MNDNTQEMQRIEPVHIVVTHGDSNTDIALRGFSSSIWGLTADQINGEFKFALTQFLQTCERLSNENMERMKEMNEGQ